MGLYTDFDVKMAKLIAKEEQKKTRSFLKTKTINLVLRELH